MFSSLTLWSPSVVSPSLQARLSLGIMYIVPVHVGVCVSVSVCVCLEWSCWTRLTAIQILSLLSFLALVVYINEL